MTSGFCSNMKITKSKTILGSDKAEKANRVQLKQQNPHIPSKIPSHTFVDLCYSHPFLNYSSTMKNKTQPLLTAVVVVSYN